MSPTPTTAAGAATTGCRARAMFLGEVILAAALLGLLTTCVFSAVELIRRSGREAGMERQALLVLDNVVERLAAETAWDTAKIERLVQIEFAGSSLAAEAGCAAVCTRQGSEVMVTVLDRGRKPLARVHVPCGS